MKVHFIPSLRLCLPVLVAAVATAQAAPAQSAPPAAPPVPYASVSELNLLLAQLEQTSQAMQLDLGKLRIEKWKTDSDTKRGTQADLASLQRNLQTALPEFVSRLRNSPENLPATFQLYRNLDALSDVFGSVAESAGAFGSRDDFQSLQNDMNGLERVRRSLADRMEHLSEAKEGEITGLRTQLQSAQAAVNTPPPAKKVVVDDTDPPKKPTTKKPAARKRTASTSSQKPSADTSSQPPQQNPPPTNP